MESQYKKYKRTLNPREYLIRLEGESYGLLYGILIGWILTLGTLMLFTHWIL